MESWYILSPEYFNEAISHSVVQTSYKSFAFAVYAMWLLCREFENSAHLYIVFLSLL